VRESGGVVSKAAPGLVGCGSFQVAGIGATESRPRPKYRTLIADATQIAAQLKDYTNLND